MSRPFTYGGPARADSCHATVEANGAAAYVAIERVTGTPGGLSGSFARIRSRVHPSRVARDVFTESAEIYDAIYEGFKDYTAEARQIAALAGAEHPGGRSILDVGCGTGEHARLLAAEHGFTVDGLDLNADFLRLARLKHPAGHFIQADMSDFHLDRRYDLVLCLFSAIGYVRTLERLVDTLRCFAQHLAPGGVVIVEPWFEPGALQPGFRTEHTALVHGRRVARRGVTEIDGRISRLRFDYVIEDPEGVRHTSELHQLGLFTTAEQLAAFTAAGLAARHDGDGLTGRGIFIARPAA
jgi:SAM-dependent methyltransferase